MTPVHAATPYCMTCRHNSTPLPRCTWSVTRYGPLGRNASHPSPSGGEYEAAVHSHQQAAAMSAAAGHRRGHGHSQIRLATHIAQLASTPRRASPGCRHLSCSATSAPRRRSDQGRDSNRPAGFQRRVDLITRWRAVGAPLWRRQVAHPRSSASIRIGFSGPLQLRSACSRSLC